PEQLSSGLRKLCSALYAPAAFGERMLRFIDHYGRARPNSTSMSVDPESLRDIDAHAVQLALGVRRMGEEERRMWYRIWAAVSRKPESGALVTRMLFQYSQIRYMFRQGSCWTALIGDTSVTIQ